MILFSLHSMLKLEQGLGKALLNKYDRNVSRDFNF